MDFDFNNSEEEKNTESYKRDMAMAEIVLEVCTRLVEAEHRIDVLSQMVDSLIVANSMSS